MAKTTLWVEYYAKQVRGQLEQCFNAEAESAQSAFKLLVDALYKATHKRNRRDGSGERAALFDIKAQIRSVYPSLSFDAKPSTVAKFVKRLVEDLGNARMAVERLNEERKSILGTVVAEARRVNEANLAAMPDPRGWKADPPAPETLKSSPGEPLNFDRDGLIDRSCRLPVVGTGEVDGVTGVELPPIHIVGSGG